MRLFGQIFCLKNLISLMGLIRDLQVQIETCRLPRGGWACGSSSRAAIETTCYALMALRNREQSARDDAIDLLLRTQNPDGSWPAFDGDDQEGCWTTSLATIALRFVGLPSEILQKPIGWLLDNKGREGHWLWRWKFQTIDRAVQFDPAKFGWPWFPGTVSWVIPTAFSVIALKQWFPCCQADEVTNRIQLGMEMLRDRACPQGGWNAGNGIVLGAALKPHIDATSIALLGVSDEADATATKGLRWVRQACIDCSSAYSVSWSTLALLRYGDSNLNRCVANLHRALYTHSVSSVEVLSLAVIAINAVQERANPFWVGNVK